MCPKTSKERETMSRVPYSIAVGSLMYAMMCTRPDVCYAVGLVSRYQSNLGLGNWKAVTRIPRYTTKNNQITDQITDLKNWSVITDQITTI